MSESFSLQIFLEAIHKASVIPFGSDLTFYVMKAFGGYDMAAPVILSVVGASLGHIVNWYIGRSLVFFEYKGKFRINPERYERIRAFAEKYGIFLLVFAYAPLMNLLVVASGFLKLPLKKVMPFVIVGLAVHYGYPLL